MRVAAMGLSMPRGMQGKDSEMPKVHGARLVALRFGGKAFQEVKLMTYNMENFFANGSARNPVKSAKSIQALAEVIRRENPDILAVQEVEGEQVLKDLSQNHLNGEYNVLCPPGSNDPRGIKVGYLYKKDIQLDAWASHLHLRDAQGPLLLRDALLAKFKFTTADGSEDSLMAITAHLKSMSGGEPKTNPIRVREAQVIHDIVAGILSVDPTTRVAVMGDMNTKSHTKYGQKVLRTLGVMDPNPHLIEVFEGQGKPPATHPGRKQPEKLDYIFMTPALFQDRIKASVKGGFKSWPWSTASDHLPISVTVNAKASVAKIPAVIPFAASARRPLRIYA